MKVFVEDDDRSVESMFFEAGWEIVGSPNDADLICFTGGADINPKLYGEEPNGARGWDDIRDQKCVLLYETFVGKIPMVGICRGGQFLNIMNGGSMIQHINGHSMGVRTINIHGFGDPIPIHEDHHQGMLEATTGEVLAWDPQDGNTEIIWYPETRCLCFQPHPEWGHKDTHELFFDLIREYIHCAD